jgi:hypothetical protein
MLKRAAGAARGGVPTEHREERDYGRALQFDSLTEKKLTAENHRPEASESIASMIIVIRFWLEKISRKRDLFSGQIMRLIQDNENRMENKHA